MLSKRCCDVYENCTNTQTIREWIHDTYRYIYHDDISDEGLNKLSNAEIEELIDELDWLASK